MRKMLIATAALLTLSGAAMAQTGSSTMNGGAGAPADGESGAGMSSGRTPGAIGSSDGSSATRMTPTPGQGTMNSGSSHGGPAAMGTGADSAATGGGNAASGGNSSSTH